MAQWRKVVVSGSSAALSALTLDTQLAVGQGGTGATTLRDGGVLLGSGTGAVTATAVLADGEMLVGDGTTDPSLESGPTLRTSIGVGTANNVEFANTVVNNLTNDSTVAASHLTGSFTGSFTGDGSNLTGTPSYTDSDALVFINSQGIFSGSAQIDHDATTNFAANEHFTQANITTVGTIGTGVWNGTSITDANVDNDLTIDGGTIDNSVIGGTTSAAGTFTTLTVDNDLTVTGNLDVNGTVTTINTTNLAVDDRFILMASGSSSGDGGIVVETDGAGSGTALGYDDSASRWALTKQDDTSYDSTTITPRQYVVSVSGSAADASGNPSDFGSAAGDRIGMMHVNTSTGDIFIFS